MQHYVYLVHPMAVPHGKDKGAECGEQDKYAVQAKDRSTTRCKPLHTFLVSHHNPYHKQDYINKYIDNEPREK